MKRTVRFSILAPVLAILLSESIFLLSACRVYRILHRAPQSNSMIEIGGSGNQFAFPRVHAFHMASILAALPVQGAIVALNVPGHFVHVIVALAQGQNGNWFPEALGPALWKVISYPIFAIPAWWFVGHGLDLLIDKRRPTKWNLWLGIGLAALFGCFGLALRFGLSEADRQGQELLSSYTIGLLLWSLLFAIPAVAWLHATIKAKAAEV
jgi:hypothetical protein